MLTQRITQLVKSRRPGIGSRDVRPALGKACGISQSAISQWFTGETRNIKYVHLVEIALAFDTTVDWLLLGTGEPPRRLPTTPPSAHHADSAAWHELSQAIDSMLSASVLNAGESAKALLAAREKFEKSLQSA